MKKRIIAVIWLMGLFVSLLMLPSGAESVNMVKNGDFEKGMNGWQLWSQDSSAAKVEVVKDGGPDGSACLKVTNTKAVATSVYQFASCAPNKTYIMTCDIRSENVEAQGNGFCLGLANYDSSNSNIGEEVSSAVFGTNDWRQVSFIFTVNRSAASVAVGPRMWFTSGTVYIDNVTLTEVKSEKAVSRTYDLELSGTPNRHTVNSLGCEWDPKLLLDVNKKHGITDDDLEYIKGRMEVLGIQAVRMMVTPDWFEKQNDNDDPNVANPDGFDMNTQEMQCLFAYLRVCQELGVRVTLTWWGAPAGHWLACSNIGDWIGAPNDVDEMAENISYLLQYARDTYGYDCIKELIIQNEPSYSFHGDGGEVDYHKYIQCYKTMRKRLDADGFSDIVLVGADDAQHYGWFYNCYEALKDVCGKFDSHNYAWSYNTPMLDVSIQSYVLDRTSLTGDIPFYLGEFGDGSTRGAYVATSAKTYGRGLYVASVVVNAFKVGASGASYWPLHDVYYYDGDPKGSDNGGLMSMGLIGYKEDGEWSYRPTYYSYGLLCNYIPFGSTVYNITGDTDHYIDAIAVKTEEGRWSIVAVNRSEVEQTIRVTVPDGMLSTALNSYLYTKDALPTDGSIIKATGRVEPESDTYTVTIPSRSFTVLSNIDMTEEEMSVETKEEETSAPAEETTTEIATEIVTQEETTSSDEKTEEKGCKSVSYAGLAVCAPAALSVLMTKRRKKKQ